MRLSHGRAKPDYVYHYTTVDGLMGIVSESKIWATHFRYVNDSSEVHYFLGLVMNELTNIPSKAHEKDLGIHAFSILSRCRWWLWTKLIEQYHVFVAAFSQDGNVLSQWRGYVPEGNGISIGIPEDWLFVTAKSTNFRPVYCEYRPLEQKKEAKRIAELYVKRLITEKPDRKKMALDSFYASLEDEGIATMEAAIRCKSPSFAEEKELRIVSPIMRDPADQSIKYRNGRWGMTPYIEVPIRLVSDDVDDRPIHVIVGPAEHTDQQIAGVTGFLASQGKNFEISDCEIPYR